MEKGHGAAFGFFLLALFHILFPLLEVIENSIGMETQNKNPPPFIFIQTQPPESTNDHTPRVDATNAPWSDIPMLAHKKLKCESFEMPFVPAYLFLYPRYLS